MEEYTTQQAQLSFKSTGTMVSTGSAYSATPTLNEDGTASLSTTTEPAKAPSGPRRVGPPTPEEEPTPIGDVLIPLFLMVMAYAISILLHRRKNSV